MHLEPEERKGLWAKWVCVLDPALQRLAVWFERANQPLWTSHPSSAMWAAAWGDADDFSKRPGLFIIFLNWFERGEGRETSM